MKKTIKSKLVVSVALVISIAMIVGLTIIYFIIDNREEEYIKKDIKSISEFATNYIYSSKVVGNNSNIYNTVNTISELFNIYTFITIKNDSAVNGKMHISKDIEDLKAENDKSISKLKLYGKDKLWIGTLYQPIYIDGEYYGDLILQKDYSDIHKLNQGILIGIGVIFLIMMAGLIIVVYLIIRNTTKPLEDLTLAMKCFGKGEKLKALEIKTEDEIGDLTKEFNNMKDSIFKLQETSKEFFGNATHELKTPLTVIKGYTQILQQEKFENEDIIFMLKNIDNESSKMTYLIQKLLTLSKDKVVLNTQKENIELKDIIEELLNLFKIIIEENQYKINLNMEDISINAIKEDIVILFSNLIDNAFKYSAGKEINIELIKNKLVISNKIGYIKEDVKEKLLEPFIKGNTNKHKNSTGLGLYICKKTCENNGFQLNYEIKEETILFEVDFNKMIL